MTMTRDDSYSPFSGWHRQPPTPVLVERLWRVRKADGLNVLSCVLYLHPLGIEARCGCGIKAVLDQCAKTRSGFVFTNPRSHEAYTVNGVAHVLKRALVRAGIDPGGVSLHTLRHGD